MSMMIAAVLLLGAAQDDLFTSASARLAIRDDRAAKPRSPYRIDPDVERGPTAKERAFAEDGQRCQVVGARMCTKRPRAVLSAPLSE